MFVDTHLHEDRYSPDSFAPFPACIERARSLGLDALCITDHDNNEIRQEARRLSQELGYLLIPGCEILTYEGDIVVFGVDDLPLDRRLHAAELLDYVHENGGVGISAHPFRRNKRGLGDYIRTLPLDGAEGFNSHTDFQYNLQACRVAGEVGLPIFGASDAHHVEDVGRYATYLPGEIHTEAEFVAAVRAGGARPAIAMDGGYTLLDYVRV